MKIAILAGGVGERTRELYPNTIKSLIEFNGKPFIYYQLGLLKRNYLKDDLHDGDASKGELSVTWKPQIKEAGVLGAAIVAGAGCGVFPSLEAGVATMVKAERVFEPEEKKRAQYDERFVKYQQLCAAAGLSDRTNNT